MRRSYACCPRRRSRSALCNQPQQNALPVLVVGVYDVAIIGGGPAGLAAALALGRSRKSVLLVDGGSPRNERAQYIGGFITQDRIIPTAFRGTAHDDLRAYPTIELHLNGIVDSVTRAGSMLTLHVGGVGHAARRLLLATGLIDDPLPLEGSRDLWGRSLFQCPYCHAYEHRDRKIGFLSPSCDECDWSFLLRSWSRDVTVFTNGAYTMSAEHRVKLGAANIAIYEGRVIELLRNGAQLHAVRTDGATVSCDALFVRPQQRQVPVVAAMGLAMTADGHVRVDEDFRTSMPGVYAAGDLATHYHGALAAASAGNQAAHSINYELTVELVEQGYL